MLFWGITFEQFGKIWRKSRLLQVELTSACDDLLCFKRLKRKKTRKSQDGNFKKITTTKFLTCLFLKFAKLFVNV